jgi:hypothetical protein
MWQRDLSNNNPSNDFEAYFSKYGVVRMLYLQGMLH